MSRQNFDRLDLSILNMLAENARKPYLEISRECGVSGAAVHQRIQRLTANGIIQGSRCLINPSSMGYETCAFVGIILREPDQYQQMIDYLEHCPEIVECYFTSGQYDILVKLYARNNDHLLHLLQDLQSLGLARTETLISFKQVFVRQVPISKPEKENK